MSVTKSMAAGPWYPTVDEHVDDAGYRFFAGRLTKHKASEAFPSGVELVQGSAGDWTFDGGEPDGSWMGLKFDRQNDEVSIACDQWLHQRWFYAQHNDVWYFSNSLVFLRQVAGRGVGIERRAVPYLLLFGYVPGRITPLKGVSLLLPGEAVTVSRGQMRRTKRTQLKVKRVMTGQRSGDLSSSIWRGYAEGILGQIQQAVRDELDGIDRIVVPLSGGMDSRFVLGCAMDVLPRDRIVTYTFGDPRTLDQKIGKGLARKLGLEHVSVAMDRRPVDDVCADGFEQTEGMFFVFPNSPLGPDRRELLKPGTCVLSGYVGDVVFGSHDVDDLDPAHNTDDFLFKKVFAHAHSKEALPLLTASHWDEMGYENYVRATSGDSLAERYERWFYEVHCPNRVNYMLFVFRNRAFYLTPFVQQKVWEYSLRLPESVRRRESGYFMAMKLGYPVLHAHPTSRNTGFSAGVQSRALRGIQRAYYQSMNALDDVLWKSIGRSPYFDPRQYYGHRHELQQPMYHSAVTECIKDLGQSPAFHRKGLDELLARYRSRLPVSTHILRALFTAREWERRYG